MPALPSHVLRSQAEPADFGASAAPASNKAHTATGMMLERRILIDCMDVASGDSMSGAKEHEGLGILLAALATNAPPPFNAFPGKACPGLDPGLSDKDTRKINESRAHLGNALYGQCQRANAASDSGSGTRASTCSTSSDNATAPRSDSAVARIMRPPNISWWGLSRRENTRRSAWCSCKIGVTTDNGATA